MRFIGSTLTSKTAKACAAGLTMALVAALLQTPVCAAALTDAGSQESQLRLLKQVEPDYPVQAKTFRIQGSVTLQALVGKDGKIRSVEVLDGHPALTGAAARAVEKWEYAPLIVDSRSFEVPTRVVVNFSFDTK